jgi:hypothetical protein
MDAIDPTNLRLVNMNKPPLFDGSAQAVRYLAFVSVIL